MSNVKVKAPKKPVKPVIVVIYILLVILAVIYLAPLLWMLSVSLKDNAGVMSAPFSLPEVFHFENYAQAWQMGKLGTALINSVIVCGATLIVSLFFGAMAAFAIARMRWKLSEFMHTFFLIGMMVPVHCVLIPLFVRFAKLGLTNSQGGLMIPYITFSLPMTIFLLTGFFRSMPGEMFEAAAIDGCGIYGCFFRIALPLWQNRLLRIRSDDLHQQLERAASCHGIYFRSYEKDTAGYTDLFRWALRNQLCADVCCDHYRNRTYRCCLLTVQ